MKKKNTSGWLAARLGELRRLADMPVDSVRQADRRMAKVYEHYCREDLTFFAAQCINSLKGDRWSLMRQRFDWSAANIARLEEANERLKAALLEMRSQTIRAFEAAKEQMPGQDIDVEGTLWAGEMVFDDWEGNPDMQAVLFDVMATETYGGFYAHGISHPFRLHHHAGQSDTPDTCDSENMLLYLTEEPRNWNELMPADKTDHLWLVYAVHNLYEHCDWALQDLLGIRSYRTKISIESSPRQSAQPSTNTP